MARRRRPKIPPIGPTLRALREGAGRTVEQVAAEMGTSKSRVSLAETAKTRPSWEWICRFAAACGFDAEVVFRPRR